MAVNHPPHPELLAPAGDWDALRAAVANGADAVYFGLSNFNARHRATNFTLDELPRVIDYLHERHVRGYVTFNTLIFSDELAEAAATIAAIAAAGADALIVQDLGLARLAARMAPALPVHGSTQMTLTEPLGIEFVRRLGVQRVILARELAIEEIDDIARATAVPVEVFVHGALCVAYSGQCLTSEALGGRSANRGQCAQACRLPYDLIVDGLRRDTGDRAYLLSPQDLAAYDRVDELARLGVASLKIEGRLKSADYVAMTTRTYRAAIDRAAAGETFELGRQERLDLAQSFSRGFSHGFLDGANHQVLVEGRFPKSRGVRLGAVAGTTRGGVVVQLDAAHAEPIVKAGDGVVFDQGHPEQDEQGGRVFEVRVLSGNECRAANTGPLVELRFGHGTVNLAAIGPSSIVWRTDDPALRRRLARTYAGDGAARRMPISVRLAGAPGGALAVVVRDAGGLEGSACWAGPLERARKHPLTAELVAEQFGRLGNTFYELAGIELDVSEPVMVPKSVLNDLRRQALATLDALRRQTNQHAVPDATALDSWRAAIRNGDTANRAPSTAGQLMAQGASSDTRRIDILGMTDGPVEIESVAPRSYVLVRSLEQLRAVLAWEPEPPLARPELVYCDFEDMRRYGEAVALAHANGARIGLATLRVVKPRESGLLRQIARSGADAVLVRNLAALEFFRRESPQTPRIGDFSLNVANELTADLLVEAGLERVVPGYDLNWEQFAALVGRGHPEWFEAVIHQHLPMFHMEHCVFAAMLSTGRDWRDCGRPCDRHRVELRDRVGADLPLVPDAGCRNTVFNAIAQSAAEYVPRMRALGVRHFRVELLRERPDEVPPLLESYARVVAGLDGAHRAWRQLQVLHQLGVTRGTLQRS